MEVLAFAGLAAVLFAATDVDDFVVLVSFFANPDYHTSEIVGGQFAGMAAIFGASVLASLVSLVVPQAAVGLLGLVPIALGVRGIIGLLGGEPDTSANAPVLQHTRSLRRVTTVATVTFANGGDNIATYAPVLATHSTGATVLFGAVVLAMTSVWCVLARVAVRHPAVVPALARHGRRVMPFLLIGLGASILWRTESLRWLFHM